MIRKLLAALQFLTTFPVRAGFTSEEIGGSACWFPVVGLALGAVIVAVDLVACQGGVPWSIRTVIAVGLSAALSGGLHLDGLADMADGFFSSRSPDRILEIMRDSRIGTMGVLALVLVLGMKSAAVGELAAGPARMAALLLAPVFGRTLQVVGLTWMPYIRPEGGLASTFLPHRSIAVGIWACAFPVSLAGVILGLSAACLLTATMSLLVAWWARSCRNTIGGMTGDTLGALSELGETTVMLTVAWIAASGGGCG